MHVGNGRRASPGGPRTEPVLPQDAQHHERRRAGLGENSHVGEWATQDTGVIGVVFGLGGVGHPLVHEKRGPRGHVCACGVVCGVEWRVLGTSLLKFSNVIAPQPFFASESALPHSNTLEPEEFS